MERFLKACQFIDCDHPRIRALALELADGCSTPEQVVRQCFLYVRDRIGHSWDCQRNPVTCAASSVLEHGTGFCYAKSHLLAALCRANGIPAGLCYQRLRLDDAAGSYCLHGLNAVWLEPYGWVRVDARGNRPGLTADFTPPVEQLPFSAIAPGEADLPEVWAAPLAVVVDALARHPDIAEVACHLPDVALWTGSQAGCSA